MLEQILNLLKKNNVFLTGGGGVGKTHLTQGIINSYKKDGKNVIKLGSTGISAVNIGGVSIHSFFKFGICKDFYELSTYDKKQKNVLKQVYELIHMAQLIVIDEISMVSSELMEMIYFRLEVGGFNGKVLFVGDFYQLPPVQNEQENGKTKKLFNFLYAFNSTAWIKFNLKNVELKISKRTQDDKFYEILKNLRVGKITHDVSTYLNSLIVSKYELDENTTMLFSRNKDADEVNSIMLERLQTPLETSIAQINILDNNINEKSFDKWISSVNSPYTLPLKIGAKIIFVVNYPFMGYYNGERGRIINIIKENGECKCVVVQKDNGDIIEIQKHIFSYTKFIKDGEEIDQKSLATFSQFPFKLAYAITIHKSQGMSIDNLVCNLNHIFANGQLYVALSRATNPANLKLIYNKSINFNNYLKNVVKIDTDVKKFYDESEFESIKEI